MSLEVLTIQRKKMCVQACCQCYVHWQGYEELDYPSLIEGDCDDNIENLSIVIGVQMFVLKW